MRIVSPLTPLTNDDEEPIGRREFEARLETLRQAIVAEHNLRRARREDDQRAMDIATERMNERLEGMNQFREQLTAQAGLFVRRDDLNKMIDRILDRVARLEGWQSKIIGALVFVGVLLPGLVAFTLYLLEH